MGTLIVYLVIAIVLFTLMKRSTRHLMLGYVGVIALIIGVLFLANAGSFINAEAVQTAEDTGSVAKVFGSVVLVVLGAIIVVVRAIRGFVSQKRFEWRVDRFHDAWNSRKDRWL